MDIILGINVYPKKVCFLFSVTYVVGIHWNCLLEAIPMCPYSICLSINELFTISFLKNRSSTIFIVLVK